MDRQNLKLVSLFHLQPERQDCDTDALSDLLMATGNPPRTDPYLPDQKISIQFVKDAVYRVFNRTTVPFIYFEVPANKSLLQPLFENTTVRDDGTLKAEILRSDNMWTLRLQGELEGCPGEFVAFLFFFLNLVKLPDVKQRGWSPRQ